MHDPGRVAVLISGRGSNMQALVEKASAYAVVLVASDRPEAAGLNWARERDIATWAQDGKALGKQGFEERLTAVLEENGAGTIALAGFMRILSPSFVERWRGRIVNIHPSLLPKYRGLDTHGRALAAGDAVSGCTVHLVTEELDSGDLLAQARVPIVPGDTPDSLAERILAEEHRLYPKALADFVASRRASGSQPTISSGSKK